MRVTLSGYSKYPPECPRADRSARTRAAPELPVGKAQARHQMPARACTPLHDRCCTGDTNAGTQPAGVKRAGALPASQHLLDGTRVHDRVVAARCDVAVAYRFMARERNHQMDPLVAESVAQSQRQLPVAIFWQGSAGQWMDGRWPCYIARHGWLSQQSPPPPFSPRAVPISCVVTSSPSAV